ncbi:MAG: DUF3291 domain-containing protein [Kiloniellales bacterium]|nr:DUF3291 domain-containing protein [Kiloniellales bacterium]MDJ0969121.1 DUF3291 domain-containing protein [Kiloniellales bacterium]MDJ0981172.1 DUF3291 domain-containing protein [Kiloniellales bacterium]
MSHHLAQMNVGTILYDLADPRMKGFVDNLERINALAEASLGFVWRLQDEAGDATGIQVTDDPRFIVNLSLWETAEALFDFVYRSAHTGIMAQRRQWFLRPADAFQVLWWLPAGEVPTVEAGLARLQRLRDLGPTPEAFTFKQRFPAPGAEADDRDLRPDPYCVGWS